MSKAAHREAQQPQELQRERTEKVPHNIAEFASRMSHENINGSAAGSRDAAAAAAYMKDHGFPNMTIISADAKKHSVTAKDKDGHLWHLQDGKNGRVVREDAEPKPWAKKDQINKDAGNTDGKSTKADLAHAKGKKPEEGWADKYNREHGFLKQPTESTDHKKDKSNNDAAAVVAAANPTERKKMIGSFDGNPDGSGGTDKDGKHIPTRYNIGGARNAWQATREMLQAQHDIAGMKDKDGKPVEPTASEIANTQKRIEAVNGKNWAKNLKAGGSFIVPQQDLREAGFQTESAGISAKQYAEGGANHEEMSRQNMPGSKGGTVEVSKGKVNDSATQHYGGGYITNGLRAAGFSGLADNLDNRTDYTKTIARDSAGRVKTASTVYGGEGATVSVRGQDGKTVELEHVRSQYEFRAANGERRVRLGMVGQADRWAHYAKDGELELDK